MLCMFLFMQQYFDFRSPGRENRLTPLLGKMPSLFGKKTPVH